MKSTAYPMTAGRPEVGIVEHEGKEYAAFGANVTPEHATAYVDRNEATGQLALTTWDGERLGYGRITASWLTPGSFVSGEMFQLHGIIDGACYTGRTAGHGMIWNAKRCKSRDRACQLRNA